MQYSMTLAEEIVKAWGACEVICAKGVKIVVLKSIEKWQRVLVALENLGLGRRNRMSIQVACSDRYGPFIAVK
jgi:hypothetical protein